MSNWGLKTVRKKKTRQPADLVFTVFKRRQRFLLARRDWVPKKHLKKTIDRTAGALAKLKHMSARFSRFEDEGRFYSNQWQERVKTMIGDEDRGVADSINAVEQ